MSGFQTRSSRTWRILRQQRHMPPDARDWFTYQAFPPVRVRRQPKHFAPVQRFPGTMFLSPSRDGPGVPVARTAPRPVPYLPAAAIASFPARKYHWAAASPSRRRARSPPPCPSRTALPNCCPRSPPGGATSTPTPRSCSTPTAPPALVADKLRDVRLRRGGHRHRAHRRRRRHQGPQRHHGPDHRPARRHGRAADPRGDGLRLCLEDAGHDARLRP